MMQGRYEGGKVAIPEEIAEKVMKLGEKEKVEDKKVEKKATRKKAEKKTPKKKTTTKKTPPTIHIQSMLGGTISYDELIKRIPADAEAVYVKTEENKAYWVKGGATGDVDLW